jgi:Soluble lytic murein transglycosylase and related regulatory proteins (some contain LysM/invasin domains)
MKRCFIISFLLLLGVLKLNMLFAQDPDPLPSPASPEKAKVYRIPEVDSVPSGYSLNDENILDFCGQLIDLNIHERRRKLGRELAVLSRYSSKLVQRANFYFPRIEPILSENGIPDDFKYLMVIESGLDPYACSGKGAAGLWQFMKGTAGDYGLNVTDGIDERFHIEKATQAACQYLKNAYRRFGNWVAVAQSYNIGPERVATEMARQRVDDPLELRLVEETNRYTYRIFAAKIIFTHPKNFGIDENLLYYKKIRAYSRFR